MSNVYRRILDKREDMTEWVLHFTRGFEARNVLARILIEGVLRPGFAKRGSPPRPTIYGPCAAVCFTEQPIASFLDYLDARNEPAWMTEYGVLVHKHDLYGAGGLPVIYGLPHAQELEVSDTGYDPTRRQLRPEDLPLDQQFRYVAFSPSRTPYPLDWSHEREWRWPADASHGGSEHLFYFAGAYFGGGDFKERVHAFVARDEDVSWIQAKVHNALSASLVGQLTYKFGDSYDGWWVPRLPKVNVISLETARRGIAAGNRDYARFEDWPSKDKHPLM